MKTNTLTELNVFKKYASGLYVLVKKQVQFSDLDILHSMDSSVTTQHNDKEYEKNCFSTGCFFGEAIKKAIGGEWHIDRAKSPFPYIVSDGAEIYVIDKVYKLSRNGMEDSLAAMYQVVIALRENKVA